MGLNLDIYLGDSFFILYHMQLRRIYLNIFAFLIYRIFCVWFDDDFLPWVQIRDILCSNIPTAPHEIYLSSFYSLGANLTSFDNDPQLIVLYSHSVF